MSPDQRARMIQRYRDGYTEVCRAIEGFTDAQLDARLDGDGWSARQVIHHLADGEATSAIRLRRLIAEERPLIVAYDEAEFARRLYYDRPIASSLALFKAARESTAEILERLTEEQWGRAGTHSESGAYSVQTWLELYVAHALEHAVQIRRAAGTA
ncbi:MAG: DinB family protein [Chloroflexota bacterium]